MLKRDSRHRIWRSTLKEIASWNPPGVTAARLADKTDLGYGSALQVLRRLRSWGYVRLVGFEDPEDGIGRPRHVYEVTPKGVAAAGWEKKKRRRK